MDGVQFMCKIEAKRWYFEGLVWAGSRETGIKNLFVLRIWKLIDGWVSMSFVALGC